MCGPYRVYHVCLYVVISSSTKAASSTATTTKATNRIWKYATYEYNDDSTTSITAMV